MSPPGPVALIINPVATRSRATERAEVTRHLAPLGLEWSLLTTASGDAGRLAARAVAEGARVVVSLGGDGTAAEVAAALAGTSVAMAALPGGNANVFSRASGWPASLRRSLPILSRALADDWRGTTTLGRIALAGDGERLFLTNAGVGIDAATVEWVEARPRVKRRMRHVSFAVAAALAAGRAGRGPRLHISADGGEVRDAVTALVACGSPYTYLGPLPLDLVPGAGFDGRLAWVALTRVRAVELGRPDGPGDGRPLAGDRPPAARRRTPADRAGGTRRQPRAGAGRRRAPGPPHRGADLAERGPRGGRSAGRNPQVGGGEPT